MVYTFVLFQATFKMTDYINMTCFKYGVFLKILLSLLFLVTVGSRHYDVLMFYKHIGVFRNINLNYMY